MQINTSEERKLAELTIAVDEEEQATGYELMWDKLAEIRSK